MVCNHMNMHVVRTRSRFSLWEEARDRLGMYVCSLMKVGKT